jgi:lipoprotein NlpD
VRVARAIGVIGFSCWVGFGCAASRDFAPQTYVVRPQDTLYSIAWRHDIDYRDLARWNGLGIDYRIAVGQVLTLNPTIGPSAAPAGARIGVQDVPSQWIWPTDHGSAPRPVPGGGILLLGLLGQPIRAACAGRVVYVGSGIRGYGNLIIIKHEDNLLSAYAHTRGLTVREGDAVRSGQMIAQMGEGPHQIAALYFEIRRDGKPIDPMPLLINAR